MAAKKRISTRSKLLKRAVKAGRTALRQTERRVPPDLRKQLERTIRDGQKTIHIAIKQVQTRLDRTARQADLDKAMKRLEGLSRQVRNLVTGSATSPAPARQARRKPSTRKPAAPKPAPRRSPTKRAATRSARVSQSPAAPSSVPEPDTERVDGF
jgi:polyhydroxyalkanoate synthesis regulator phasin